MKLKNVKYVFLVLIALMLVLTGCKSNNVIEVSIYELVEDTYVKDVSNDLLNADLSEGITLPKGATIKYYKDSNHKVEVNDSFVDVVDGDNLFYAVVTFKNKETQDLKLNLHHLKMCTVTFITNCGMNIPEMHVEEKTVIKKPDVTLKKYGYGFTGWDYNFRQPIMDDTKISAKWEEGSFTVTYDPKGGEMLTTEIIVTFNEEFQLETPSKKGYEFVGWYYNGKPITGDKWRLDGDITIEAMWEEETQTYEIDYEIVGCVGPNLQRTYTNKEEVILRKPYKCGYRFIGWYMDGNYSGERIYTIPKGTTGNLYLYSRWEKFNLDNSKVSFLGDSISTFYEKGSLANSLYTGDNQFYFPRYSKDVKKVNDTWWYQVITNTKANLLVNESLSSSSVYNNGSEECTPQASMNYKRINNLKGSEVVIINMGTNDVVNGITVEKFTKAYDTMLKRINEVCPDVFILCCTLGYTGYTGYNYTEENRIKFNEAINKVAIDNDASIIDFNSVQTIETSKSMLGDAIHPNKNGMKILGDFATKTLKEYFGSR